MLFFFCNKFVHILLQQFLIAIGDQCNEIVSFRDWRRSCCNEIFEVSLWDAQVLVCNAIKRMISRTCSKQKRQQRKTVLVSESKLLYHVDYTLSPTDFHLSKVWATSDFIFCVFFLLQSCKTHQSPLAIMLQCLFCFPVKIKLIIWEMKYQVHNHHHQMCFGFSFICSKGFCEFGSVANWRMAVWV
jgi:hypothetical protein